MARRRRPTLTTESNEMDATLVAEVGYRLSVSRLSLTKALSDVGQAREAYADLGLFARIDQAAQVERLITQAIHDLPEMPA